jgi:hypothetical protein
MNLQVVIMFYVITIQFFVCSSKHRVAGLNYFYGHTHAVIQVQFYGPKHAVIQVLFYGPKHAVIQVLFYYK